MFILYKRNAQLQICRVCPLSPVTRCGGLLLGATFRWVVWAERTGQVMSRFSQQSKSRHLKMSWFPQWTCPLPARCVWLVHTRTFTGVPRTLPCAWDPCLVGRRMTFPVWGPERAGPGFHPFSLSQWAGEDSASSEHAAYISVQPAVSFMCFFFATSSSPLSLRDVNTINDPTLVCERVNQRHQLWYKLL